MSGDVHVRICEGLGVRLPWATRLVIGCELEADARRLMAVLPQRFTRCGLSIHPSKTAVIACRKPEAHQRADKGNGTCDLLELTHYWTQSRRGLWVIKRRTASKRLHRTKKAVWRWCRTNRHASLKDQYQRLCLKLPGHFRSYGIRGNCRLLEEGHRYAEQAWRYWLGRRSSKRASGWEQFQQLLQTSPLPIPRIVHSNAWWQGLPRLSREPSPPWSRVKLTP
jgi:RNA-directed DNA polymerase